MPDITIPVPEARVPEFFKWYGDWLEGSPSPTPSAPPVSKIAPSGAETPEPHHNRVRPRWADTAEDLALAQELWPKMSARARAIIEFLMSHPGKRFTGDEIADAADIPHGAPGVAGTLTWPSRYCTEMDRQLPSEWDEIACKYWLQPEVASLFDKVRGD